MKLINSDNENRWVIVDEVSDDDAKVLQACGFRYIYDVDENGYNGEDEKEYPYEIWYNKETLIMYKFNDNEKKFIETLENAKRYVKGELEIDNIDGEWFAMDYIEGWGGAFSIDVAPYDKPLITEEKAKEKGIDVGKCCDYCHAYIVG